MRVLGQILQDARHGIVHTVAVGQGLAHRILPLEQVVGQGTGQDKAVGLGQRCLWVPCQEREGKEVEEVRVSVAQVFCVNRRFRTSAQQYLVLVREPHGGFDLRHGIGNVAADGRLRDADALVVCPQGAVDRQHADDAAGLGVHVLKGQFAPQEEEDQHTGGHAAQSHRM